MTISLEARYSTAEAMEQLVAQLGGRVEPISYWVMVGEHVALSGTEQKLAQLQYGMRGLIADGLLMRVSSINREAEKDYALHQRFLADAYQAMNPALRSRPIVGLQMMRDFAPAGPGRWTGGKIYDPNTGRTYDSKMSLSANGGLKVEGCVTVICQAQAWTTAD